MRKVLVENQSLYKMAKNILLASNVYFVEPLACMPLFILRLSEKRLLLVQLSPDYKHI